jgi:hypothetical protein
MPDRYGYFKMGERDIEMLCHGIKLIKQITRFGIKIQTLIRQLSTAK